jgi:flagellar basal-body rod modification protein FlgD
MGRDQFMTLLVTQLRNQDPLEPLDNAQFIAQLATFSSLEKLTSIESLLESRLPSAPEFLETEDKGWV